MQFRVILRTDRWVRRNKVYFVAKLAN